MEATLERELYGYTVGTLPVTEDAKMAVEHLLRAYPEWQLRRVGLLERIVSLSQRLSLSIRDEDVEAICRIRVSLRDSITKMERVFGGGVIRGDGSPANVSYATPNKTVGVSLRPSSFKGRVN